MIDPSNCIRYTLREDIESVCQKLIFWLSDNYPEIFLIHQESYNHRNRISTRLTLIHRHWGPTFIHGVYSISSIANADFDSPTA